MFRRLVLCFGLLLAGLLPFACHDQSGVADASLPAFPDDFSDKAYAHVEQICAYGPRPATSAQAVRTSRYVLDQFRAIGLPAEVEEFEFGSFDFTDLELRAGDYRGVPVGLGLNPYDGTRVFRGTALFVDPAADPTAPHDRDRRGRDLIAPRSADHFKLMAQRPRLIIYLQDDEFERLKDRRETEFELSIEGTEVQGRAANVVAVVGPRDASHEIILTAHLDAYRDSPGADDDASGLGVLLELARYFKSLEESLTLRIRFVALGAEELGLVGARAYTARHAEELKNCVLSVDIDQVGGPRGPHVAIRGGVSESLKQQGRVSWPSDLEQRAWEGLTSYWRLLDERLVPVLGISNQPAWLESLVRQSARELGIEINATSALGGNGIAFAMAGVVSTAVGSSGNVTHAPGDVPQQVRRDSLERTGSLIARVVLSLATAPQGSNAEIEPDRHGPSRVSAQAEIAAIVSEIAASSRPGQRRSALLRWLQIKQLPFDLVPFETGDRIGTNILLEPVGSGSPSVLLVAHYDCVPAGHGAIDNASGVAAVLSLLESLSANPLRNLTVQVLFTDLEETDRLGAKAYLEQNRSPELVLCLDVFGYGDVLWVTGEQTETAIGDALESAARQHGVGITWESGTPRADDHAFRDFGIDAIGLSLVSKGEVEAIRQLFHAHEVFPKPRLAALVHSDEDLPDKIVAADIVRAVAVVESALRRLDRPGPEQ